MQNGKRNGTLPHHRQEIRAALAEAAQPGGRGGWWSAVVVCGVLISGLPAMGQTPPRPAPSATTRPLPVGARSPEDSLEGEPVARVEVTGNTRTDARTILDQIRLSAGQLYSRAAVDQDVRTIAAMERFVTVRADVIPTNDQRVVVRFVVQERPLVTAVEITGNHKKNDEQIRDVMQTHPGMGVDPFVIQTDINAIENLYKKDGYNFAQIRVDQKLLEEQGIARFQIEEGPQSRISSVRFDGNASLKSDFLKSKIQTRSSFWIFRKGVLNEDTIESDMAAIRDTYASKGWIDCRVSHSIEYSDDKKKITVRFIINEGPHYRIGNVVIAGNKVFSTEQLLGDMTLTTGDFLDRARVEASAKHMDDRYGHEGYIYHKVDPKTEYAAQPAVVDLHIDITEGEAYSVGQVMVRGNPEVQDRVIRRQVRVYPDQTYDTVLVAKSIDRLKATQLFNDVKITPIGNEESVRDALVEVQEGQTGRYQIGAGISTNNGLVGQLSVEQRNFDITNWPHSMGEFLRGQSFKGAGQYFRILLEPGTEFQRYRVTFEEPYLFDSPYSGGNDAYYFTRKRESWDEKRLGDIVTLGRRFDDVWSASLGLRAEQVSITNIQYFGGVPGEDVTLTNSDGTTTVEGNTAQEIFDQQGNHFITSIKPGIVRDTTNSRMFPSAGTITSLSWEQYGAMGGDLTMSKIVARFDWFHTLHTDLFDRKTVLISRNEFGFIPLGDSVFYERFYGGGIGSLRAFKFRGVSPRSGVLQDPVGGDFSWVSTVEVNYPIYEELLRGVVFTDWGTVESDIAFDQIRGDAGIGFRINIPFFGGSGIPLAIDFGYPFLKQNFDKTQVVSFSLSTAF